MHPSARLPEAWNGCPRSRGIDAHLPWNTQTGLVAHSECDYFAPIAFPDPIEVGLRVARLGGSSVTYRLGIFRENGQDAIAQGLFVHVYVDRETSRPVQVPDTMRDLLQRLAIPEA